ncbi:MAG: HAD family hydrolase [Alphaproteobacteria bacterium]|nr:HAD family hydrolase [Alphaproteobacteria bacterium]
MKNIKAIFADCDGTLYNKQNCTYYDMAVVAFGKALDILGIPKDALAPVRARLKANGVHGLLNAALALCQERQIDFNVFAREMVKNTDYSRIPEDWDMLRLLRMCGTKLPVYIVTNNTAPHLQKVLNCLKGAGQQDIASLKIHTITIEDTFYDGVFHPKKTGTQLTDLCAQIGQQPQDVLLLDDTQDVCDVALAQGLQANLVETPYDTKMILRRIVYEEPRLKRVVPVRKTRRFFGR